MLKIKPDYVDAYYNLGNIFKDQGKFHDAIEAYKNTISLNLTMLKLIVIWEWY